MLKLEEAQLDSISEVFYRILRGEQPDPISLPPDQPEDEYAQVISYLNRFVDEYNGLSGFMYSLSRGELDSAAPAGKMRVLQSVKNLQASLRHLTWKTQRIATGDFRHRIDFMGDFSAAFNSMTQQLQQAFADLEEANQLIRQTFGRYLSDEIVQEILGTPNGMKLGGVQQVVTIMMVDILGFTAICERLSAEEVVSMLNQYFDAMTDIILRYQGTIDEFLGDGILAMFGAPIQREDDAQRALACALEMQLAMEEVNRRNREKGFPEIEIGIGVHTGEVIVGNLGSHKRTKYGLVGHNVNLTSRIESYAVGGQVLISDDTRKACGDCLRIKHAQEVMPKGVKDPITIYEVSGIDGDFNIFLPQKSMGELTMLSPPIPIEFTLLEGKHVGATLYAGKIVKLGEAKAEIEAECVCQPLTNLKVSVLDGKRSCSTKNTYAKITEICSHTPPTFLVAFTSLPPEAKSFFQQALYG
ncbi:MAG: adenylate/guanylate cyclase domain-containing protein [Candidatus Electrothrix scaldis]|nr:MAG: adenylate/guanylate cyclase domain-containing protein [Candidatus Electrothrix sp. GW3-3]